MQEVLNCFAQYLEGVGFGTIGVNIFTEGLPNTPTIAIAVVPSGGPGEISPALDRVNISIQVRDKIVDSADATAEAIWVLVQDVWNLLPTITGRIQATNVPLLARDSNNMPIFIFNAQLLTSYFKPSR